jgi:ADP-heptose:LPS heptosyltransferase
VKILAIRLARFGDIVLLLPALSLLKARFPQSHLTFLTDQRWAPLAMMCPAIDEVVAIDRLGMRDGSVMNALNGIRRVGKEVRRRRFDVAIDFHGFRETGFIAWWSGAPKRMGMKRFDQSYPGWCFNLPPVIEDKQIHASEMFVRVAQGFQHGEGSTNPAGASMIVTQSAKDWANKSLPASPYVALYIDGPVKERIWPKEKFAELARHFVGQFRVPVVVLSSENRGWEDASEDVRPLFGLSVPELAAAIGSSRLLVSNDTGPMHLGPALGVPTVGIFSVGYPQHFRPTGKHDLYVQANPIEQVTVRDVIDAADRVWTASDR